MKRRLTLLTREGCHLCEDYAEALLAQFGERIELGHADVGERVEWLRDYARRIPVLLDEGGRVLGEGIFDADQVGRSL